jgi:hypothetical protein
VLDPKKTSPQPLLSTGWEYVGTSEWDVANARVLIHMPRSFLRSYAILPPYRLAVVANNAGTVSTAAHDDWAPAMGETFGITAPTEKVPAPAEDARTDDDQDGVPDASDSCPLYPGTTGDGCTARIPSQVRVLANGKVVGVQDVYADHGSASFRIPVDKPKHDLVVEWIVDGEVRARSEL